MAKDEEHCVAVDRLWRAVRRDLAAAIEEYAGFRECEVIDPDGHLGCKAIRRFERNWERLCDTDLDVATSLYHGLREVGMGAALFGKANSPADHHLRRLDEITGMAEIARAGHPHADVQTLGELIALGEKAVKDEIEHFTEGDIS